MKIDLSLATVAQDATYDDERYTGVSPGSVGLGDIEDPCATESRGRPTGKISDPCLGCVCRRAEVIGKGAYVVPKSGNEKIGRKGKKECATTYASQETCPRTCAFLGNGCYGEGGQVAMAVMECNESCEDEWKCAQREAASILHLALIGVDNKGSLPPLRLHTVGDCRTVRSAELVAQASDEYIDHYQSRGNFHLKPHAVPVWTYTHAWREIPRRHWGSMSVLASCNTLDEVLEAGALGWMCSYVVGVAEDGHSPAGRSTKPYDDYIITGKYEKGHRVRFFPCPAQVSNDPKNVACTTCQLCWQEQHHVGRDSISVVLLGVHGTKETIKAAARVAAGAKI